MDTCIRLNKKKKPSINTQTTLVNENLKNYRQKRNEAKHVTRQALEE